MNIEVAALITAIAVTIFALKMGISNLRRLLYYDLYVDLIVTIFLAWIWAGTYSGMFAAIMAGVILSLVLITFKLMLGYEELVTKHCPHCHAKHRVWVHKKHGKEIPNE
jgi:hypothetical protein